ncbi:MAG: PilN domain-containing protein [Oceanicoccus sp.]
MQHLNLYSQLDHTVEPPFSFRQMILAVIIIFIVMLVLSAWLAAEKSSQSAQLEPLLLQQQLVNDELEQLRAQKNRMEKDNTIDRKIAALNTDVLFRRRLLETLDPVSADLDNGFSDHLQGLARQSVDGVWFTNIFLQEGGLLLSLSGRTTSPELVPQFLKRLAAEPIYQGHRFRIFKIHSSDDNANIWDFEIKAQDFEK